MNDALVAEMKRVFTYYPETGDLFRAFKSVYKKVGAISTDQHYQVKYKNVMYQKTQIIWIIMYGRLPNGVVDHIDRNGLNDKWDNLREASNSQNKINATINKNNTSSIPGVSYHKGAKKWQVYITKDYARIYLGCYSSFATAKMVREAKEKELFGEFATGSAR